MAVIKKTITGLKPNQNYIFTLKAKNTEISALDDSLDSIRIQTPGDSTIPSSIENSSFYIYGNYKSVMFTFEPTNDIDISHYVYELYSDSLGSNLISTGQSSSTVFAIDVPSNTGAVDDSSAQINVYYYRKSKDCRYFRE